LRFSYRKRSKITKGGGIMTKYMEKTIEELHELLKNKEVTSGDLIKESLSKSHEVGEKYNAS